MIRASQRPITPASVSSVPFYRLLHPVLHSVLSLTYAASYLFIHLQVQNRWYRICQAYDTRPYEYQLI
jgi:hypothetical protein